MAGHFVAQRAVLVEPKEVVAAADAPAVSAAMALDVERQKSKDVALVPVVVVISGVVLVVPLMARVV